MKVKQFFCRHKWNRMSPPAPIISSDNKGLNVGGVYFGHFAYCKCDKCDKWIYTKLFGTFKWKNTEEMTREDYDAKYPHMREFCQGEIE